MVEKVHIPIVSEEYLRTNSYVAPSDEVINGVFYKKGNSVWVRQRPAIKTTLAPDAVFTTQGRCLSYDPANGVIYYIGGNELWTLDSDWTTPLFDTQITPATNASGIDNSIVYFEHAVLNGNSFFVTDYSGSYGQGKWVEGAGATYYDMDTAAGNGGGTFTYFPPMNSKKLAGGIEELDKTLYVLTNEGEIWGSDLNDGTSWTDAANFITAERVQDTSVWLVKHNNHLVVFGTRSIEFFYNASNPVGSPLSRRTDIFYNIGVEYDGTSTKAITRHKDIIYFVGQSDFSGGTGVYKLENMQLSKISSYSIDAELEDSNSATMMSVLEHRGKVWILVTPRNPTTNVPVSVTYVYDTELGLWSRWSHPNATAETFPICKAATHEFGDQILLWQNGNISLFRDDSPLVPGPGVSYLSVVDLTQASIGGAYTDTDNVEITVRLPAWDNNNRDWKFHHQLRYVGQETDNSETLTINWYDEQDWNGTASGTTTIDISSNKNKATRLGRAKSRTYELYYEGDELFACNGLELEFSDGTH